MFDDSAREGLQKAINLRIDELQIIDDENDQERVKTLDQLVGIRDKMFAPRFAIDPNVIVMALVSLAEIGLMLNYEKLGVITSKVLPFIPKPRL